MQKNTTDQLVKMAWETTKTHWKEFIILPIAINLPIFTITIFLFINESELALFISGFLGLTASLFTIAFNTAITKWCADLYGGAEKLDIKGGLRYGVSRLLGVMGTMLITAFKVFLWGLLLFTPGYYKWLMYSKSIKVSQLEKISGGAANRISEKIISEAGPMRTLGNLMALSTMGLIMIYIYGALTFMTGGVFLLINNTIGILVLIILSSGGALTGSTFLTVYKSYEYLAFREENEIAINSLVSELSGKKIVKKRL